MQAETSPPLRSPTLAPLGQDGVLVRFGDGVRAHPQEALAFAAAVGGAGLLGVVEIAPALASVLVRFDPEQVSRAQIIAQLEALLQGGRAPESPKPHRIWTIPACFGGEDGPQLDEASALAGITDRAAIAQITAQELSVLAIGFAPGQPYLGMLPDNWAMPRQSGLTPMVPAGALVTALRQLVLFANPSPTGWRWIGSCAFLPFMASRAQPFALRPDDRIRFVQTDAATIADLRAHQADGLGGARWDWRA